MKWLILILGVLSNASASVLVKFAVAKVDDDFQIGNILSFLSNIPLILGVFLYGIAFILYTISLTYLPLNVAHPTLTSGSIAVVAIASFMIFGESLAPINLLGIVLISIGVVALTTN